MSKYLLNRSFLAIGVYGEFCRKRDEIIKQFMLSYFPRVSDSIYSPGCTKKIDIMRKIKIGEYPELKYSVHGNFSTLEESYLFRCAPTVIDVIPIQIIEKYYGMNPNSSIEQAAIELKEITDCSHTIGYIMRYLYAYFREFKDGYYFHCSTDDDYPTGEIVRVFPCNNIFINRGYHGYNNPCSVDNIIERNKNDM